MHGEGYTVSVGGDAPARAGLDAPGAPGAADGGSLSHLAYLYDDERDFVSDITAFAAAGRRNAEPVFLAVPGRRGALLRERLGAESGSLRYGAMAETGRNPARLIPELREFIDQHPGHRIRYVGEAVWAGRTAAELREATRHEALINLAFATTPATILCPYDLTRLPPSAIGGARHTHPAILRDGRTRAASGYAGLGVIPAECEAPLSDPPAGAEIIDYRTSLREVRALVADHSSTLGLPGEQVTNLVIAVGEITANTLRHTRAGGTFGIWHTADEIICQAHDQGWITDPLAGRTRQPPEAAGHGLWVVNQVCDLVEIRTGRAGTTIRLHMRRGPRA